MILICGDVLNIFKTINNKIKDSKEKSRQKEEEEIKLLKYKIKERTLEFNKILEDYENYVKDKRSFYILLKDINLYDIYYGTMTFYENHVELLPINEGKTGLIPYNKIRKVKIEKCKIKSPEKFLFTDLSISFDGIFISLYLHSGEVHVIKVFNTVTSYKDTNYPYPNSMDTEGYINFSSWWLIL